MNTWTPIWNKLPDSSIWLESKEVKILFVTMLALKDRDHVVRLNAFELSRKSNLTEQEVIDALEVLKSPDTKRLEPQEYEGRRIERVEDGWLILNGEKYREKIQEQRRREYCREKMREYRSRGSENKSESQEYHKDARSVLFLMNELTGRHYRETDGNLRLISSRLSEDGVDFEGVGKMLERQCLKWKNDPKMSEYLRPETLFNKTKFDGYYAARNLPLKAGEDPSDRNTGTANDLPSVRDQYEGIGKVYPNWTET
jgi:uncharacterized phage protein (TIGR02220 family)